MVAVVEHVTLGLSRRIRRVVRHVNDVRSIGKAERQIRMIHRIGLDIENLGRPRRTDQVRVAKVRAVVQRVAPS